METADEVRGHIHVLHEAVWELAAIVMALREAGATDPAHTGVPAAVSDVAALLTERDRIDSTRAASPLSIAPDAVVIDTTGKSVDEVVRDVLAIVRVKTSGAGD